MSFSWPWALLALLAVPLLLAARWWLNRRRKRTAITVSSVAVIRAALAGRTSWKRRLPAWLFLAGFLPLAVGLARPQATVALPRNGTSILLAIDVSGSMCSTDVQPNRLTVATDAAREFIGSIDDGTRVGIVAFSGVAGLLVAPTTDKGELLDAVDTLKTARGTAIGQAILTSIDAIAETNPDVAATGVDLETPGPQSPTDYQPDTIVVLTDGSNTTGVQPGTAAEQAAARRIRVFTIGFGTTDPAPMVCSPDQIGGDLFAGGWGQRGQGDAGRFGGGGNLNQVLQIDEEALQQVADSTGGEYLRAEDADQLVNALDDLPGRIGLQEQEVEISAWFMLAGTLLTFTGVGLALWWNRGPSRRQPL
ncbi:VWA domain-containing protein [Actinoplanes sp. CA-131856]